MNVHYDEKIWGVDAYGRDAYEWFAGMSGATMEYVPSYQFFKGKTVTKFEVFYVCGE